MRSCGRWGVPAGLVALVLRLLEKDPAARPQTAERVLDALQSVGDRIVRALVDPARHRHVPPFPIAMAYAGLGDADEAFRWLDAGYAQRAPFMDAVKVTAAFQPLHGDPRWNRSLARMGHDP